jgi:hypothetical protein
MLVYFGMSRDGLRNFRLEIRIPIVTPAMPHENAPYFCQLMNEIRAFHWVRMSSSTFLMYGTVPELMS